MDKVRVYFQNKGNITGFLPRWAFLVFGVVVMVYEMISYPVGISLLLTAIAFAVFFVFDHFAPGIFAWLSERKRNATSKFEEEKQRA